MTDWRQRLRDIVGGWKIPPEEQSAIIDELEEHLELEFADLAPRIGQEEALRRVLSQIDHPDLARMRDRIQHRPAPSVTASRERASGGLALLRDVRYGWRSLGRSGGTTAMAVGALALGIGLTAMMFTIIYSILLRGLPFENGNRIAMVMEANPSQGIPELPVSRRAFRAFRDGQRSFDKFGAWAPTTASLSGDGPADQVSAALLTASALEIPDVRPALGRTLLPADELPESNLAIVVSYSIWRDRYALDSGIVGRAVRINGKPATVVGVMPDGFAYPRDTRLWLPLRVNPGDTTWRGRPPNGVGLLKEGVSIAAANADLNTIAARVAAEFPEANKGVRAVVQPFIKATIPTRVAAFLYAMFGAVALVFLIACVNVANLMFARAIHRTREVAIRIALGASRLAIVRQFFVESVVLAGVAAVVGALIAKGGAVAFERAFAGQLPFWAELRLDPQVILFIAGAALLATMLSALWPAITAARSDMSEIVKQHAGLHASRGGRLSRALVVFELVLSCGLLVAATAATRSVLKLRVLAPGFRTDGILTGRVTLTTRDTAARRVFHERLAAGLTGLPGATAVSLSSGLPGTGWYEDRIAVEGTEYASPRLRPRVRRIAADPGFFRTFDIPVARGRAIDRSDRAGTNPVAVVNQEFVDQNFAGKDALGARIDLTPGDSTRSWVTIVGITPRLYAVSPQGQENPWPSEVITALAQDPAWSVTIAVATSNRVESISRPLQSVVASLDPDIPVYAMSSMRDVIAGASDYVRIFGGLFVAFGIAALTLAAIGLYAVLAFSVSRREREMGIRMAVGAKPSDIVRLIARDGGIQLAVGISLGLLLGVAITRLAQIILFEVRAGDPVTLAIVASMLLSTGAAATLAPGIRAATRDPVRSLRVE